MAGQSPRGQAADPPVPCSCSGSHIENWHSILRNGLVNASYTKLQVMAPRPPHPTLWPFCTTLKMTWAGAW